MTTTKRFAVFDTDTHVVEPREVWEEYLEPEYRTLGKAALWREDGQFGSYLKVNGKMFRDTMNTNIPRHAIWKPGMTWDQVGELDPNTPHAMNAGASNPHKPGCGIWMLWGWTSPSCIPPGSPKAFI